jgi:hypothetical protein
MNDVLPAPVKAARRLRRRFASRLAIYGGAAAAVTVAHALIH